MFKLVAAVVLTVVCAFGLAALMVPGLNSLQDGLESGKRIALARYAELAGR